MMAWMVALGFISASLCCMNLAVLWLTPSFRYIRVSSCSMKAISHLYREMLEF